MGLGNGILTLGAFGQGILQGRVLGLAGASSEQMLEIMNASGSAVALTGVSLALQALETCAAPIFALLLVEEGLNAANWKQDIIWILGLAVVTEIPYNLAVSGTPLVPGSLNPVFAVAPVPGPAFILSAFFWKELGKPAGQSGSYHCRNSLGAAAVHFLRYADGGSDLGDVAYEPAAQFPGLCRSGGGRFVRFLFALLPGLAHGLPSGASVQRPAEHSAQSGKIPDLSGDSADHVPCRDADLRKAQKQLQPQLAAAVSYPFLEPSAKRHWAPVCVELFNSSFFGGGNDHRPSPCGIGVKRYLEGLKLSFKLTERLKTR